MKRGFLRAVEDVRKVAALLLAFEELLVRRAKVASVTFRASFLIKGVGQQTFDAGQKARTSF